ncbi:deoxyribonuclease I-like 1-like isoform X2 [Cyclopterus lumpus]|nr:deoxyribonuclease I-like 1-like isoform X2 [Cyclopterus lumpus]XP_034392768.1 deoxyribonuclease I-like 1-like isoform X2 [Cyclopterus lumpus]XP_034392769.1 deoxyribonuclease I-like 1-like isoform X2 [Cyclopterus lumpus]
METKDINMAKRVDEEQCDDTSEEEDFEGGKVMNRDKTPEQDYSSSEGETEEIGSGEDEEAEEDNMRTGEKSEDLSRLDRCGNEFCEGNKEDRIFTEGQPLDPQGAEHPQVRNKEQGESESDEEVSYFERVPERGIEMMIRGDGIEEDEQERKKETKENLCDSEREGMKIKQEETAVLALCCEQKLENPSVDGPAKANLEFPEISVQHLQDLFTEVDSEKYGEKMKDFSGEEHQDAGESFADYPSDFSSCEYVEDGGTNQEKNHQSIALACPSDNDSIKKQETCQERAVTDVMWMGRAEDTDEEGGGYLYSRDLEVDSNEFRSLDVADREKDIVENVSGDAAVTAVDEGGATGESDSYTSSDDEVQVKRSDEELLDCMRLQDLESSKQLEETHGESGAAFSDDYNRVDPADFNNYWNLDVSTTDSLLSEDLLTTEDTDEADTPPSDVTQHCAEDGNSYSVVQRGDAKTTNRSNQGSLDDSFFFNTEHEASGIMETGQLGEDEYEEERNWEQEQKRIKAFYEFYDDSDGENKREGRPIKVQFCADPLSQVIHYETDSSDRASLSSSTDGEEDLSSADTSEEFRELDDATEMSHAGDPPNTQPPENVPDISNTHICNRKHKCFNMLKLTLKMALVILTGLLMFWFATDQAGWFSHVSFF